MKLCLKTFYVEIYLPENLNVNVDTLLCFSTFIFELS